MWSKFFAFFSLFWILGCDQSTSHSSTDPDQQYTIGVSVSNANRNPFFSSGYNAFAAYPNEHHNVKVILDDAKDSQSAQSASLQRMVTQGAQALIVNLVDINEGKTITDIARNANIPIVFWNRTPGNDILFSYNKALFVSGDETQAGVLQGLAVLEAWKNNPSWDRNKDGVIQYALLRGIPDTPNTTARSKWSVNTLQSYPELATPIEELFNESGMFRSDLGNQITKKWLESPRGRDIEIILANNDNMAIGSIEAQHSSSFPIPTFGIDAIPQALELIESGELAGTVLNDAVTQANVSIEAAINLINNLPANTDTDYRLSYQHINIPYKAL